MCHYLTVLFCLILSKNFIWLLCLYSSEIPHFHITAFWQLLVHLNESTVTTQSLRHSHPLRRFLVPLYLSSFALLLLYLEHILSLVQTDFFPSQKDFLPCCSPSGQQHSIWSTLLHWLLLSFPSFPFSTEGSSADHYYLISF